MKVGNSIKALDKILIVLIISMAMLVILEGASYSIITVYQYLNLSSNESKYQFQNNSYWNEYYNCTSQSVYSPYVDYLPPLNFSGQYVNTDKNFRRTTWNSPRIFNKSSTNIFCFGGSTMWGYGSKDNYTIASYLSKNLYAKGYPAKIINFGVEGYTSTQELARLLLELRNGDAPDIVIFYDGYNDIRCAFYDGTIGGPWDLNERKAEFNYMNNPMQFIINYCYQNSYTIKLIKGGLKKFFGVDFSAMVPDGPGSKIKSEEISKEYFGNIRIIQDLGKAYGFKTYFFLQPVLFTKKYISANEKETLRSIDAEYANFFNIRYNYIRSKITLSNATNIYYIGDVFDGTNATIYMDAVHTSEDGNRIIANRIAYYLIPKLRPKIQ